MYGKPYKEQAQELRAKNEQLQVDFNDIEKDRDLLKNIADRLQDNMYLIQDENKKLKNRLKPAEFFTTELTSLEQVVPLHCRNEVNAVIDKVMAEVGRLEAKNKKLKREMNNLIDIAMKIRREVIARTNLIVGRP